MFLRLRFDDLPVIGLILLLSGAAVQLLSVAASLTWLAAGLIAVPTLLILTALALHPRPRIAPEVPSVPVWSPDVKAVPSAPVLGLKDDRSVDLGEGLESEREGLVVQSWCRRIDAAGREAISGELLVHFAAGERTAVVHVPCQPALAAPPRVWMEVIDGDAAQVEADLVRPYGMRLVARRSENVGQPGTTRIEFYVAATDAIRTAA